MSRQEADDKVAEIEPRETPIPSESLMPLLEAEFALRYRDYDRGLNILTVQSATLADPAVTRRALRLAEFLNDAERAAQLSVRLVELTPDDAAAVAAASGWLVRTGQPVAALGYIRSAYELDQPVNVATVLGTYEQLDAASQAEIAEAITSLANSWPDDNEAAIAASLLARLEGEWELAASLVEPVLDRAPEDTRAILLWTQIMLDKGERDPLMRLAQTVMHIPIIRNCDCNMRVCWVQSEITRVRGLSLSSCWRRIPKTPSYSRPQPYWILSSSCMTQHWRSSSASSR